MIQAPRAVVLVASESASAFDDVPGPVNYVRKTAYAVSLVVVFLQAHCNIQPPASNSLFPSLFRIPFVLLLLVA